MKWQRRRSKQKRNRSNRGWRRKPSILPLELLEERQVLAANVLADAAGTLAADTNSELTMTVEIPGAGADTVANLAILTTATDDSSLDPSAVVVQDSSGNELTPIATNDDANGSSDGLTVIGLAAGDYTLVLADQNATAGEYQLQVSLLGDTEADAGQVTQTEETLASAALLQSLGSGNFVTEQFYLSLGIDLGVSQFDSGMDANGDGSLSANEFSLIQANNGIGAVNIVMQSDSTAPELTGLELQNDTGVSDSDGITTDPTIAGSIVDDSPIASFTASLDGGDEFDLTTLFDPNAAADFTLSQSDLDQIAGGTLAGGEHTLTLTATDDQGNASPAESLSFTFVSGTTAPTTTDIGDQDANEDDAFSLDVSSNFSDTDDGDTLTFSVGTLPGWLAFDPDTATFSGTPENADVGSTTVTVTASDSQGASVSNSFTLNVINTNDNPSLSLVSQTVDEDTNVSIDLNSFATDPDVGDTLSFSVDNLPGWLTLDNDVLTGTPENGDVGDVTLNVTVTDGAGGTDQGTLLVTVVNVNDAPTVLGAIEDQTVDEGQQFSLGVGVFFQDVDAGDTLSFNVSLSDGGPLPAWLSFDSATNILSGTPGNNDLGRISVRVTATDSAGASVSDDFLLDVGNVNDPPVAMQIPPATATQDQAFALDITGDFSDPDPGDSLSYTASLAGGGALPNWLSFDGPTGTFSGTPGNDDVANLSITVTATDLAGLSASSTFDLDVADVNAAPTVVAAVADQTLDQGQSLSLDVSGTFDDEDLADVLTLSAALTSGDPLPAWLDFNPATNTFSGTPGNDDVGVISVDLTATDLAGSTATDTFTITVNNVNDPPQIETQSFNVDPDTAMVGTLAGNVVASDIDGDNLTFDITSGDTVTFAIDDAGDLTIADTTAIVEDATFTLTVTVTDDGDPTLNSSADVVVTVTGNLAPTANDDDGFTIPDNEVLEINTTDLLANDTDPDNDSLEISSVNSTSQLGARIQLVGTTINYDPSASTQLAELHNGDQLVDTFQYTVSDGVATDTATVTVTVTGIDVVEFTLVTTDADGNEITEVQTGQTFELRAFVQDIRPDNPRGVFSAYLDVTYPTGTATPTGSIVHSLTYGSANSGSTATPGLLDEVGGVDGISQLGGDVFEVFRLEFTAGAVPATVTFASDVTEDQTQHPVLLFGGSSNLNPAQIIFGTTSIDVVGLAAPLAADGSDRDPMDVNDDGDVSPLDALMIANHISGSGGPNEYMDVNRDGSVSPIDMLLVINTLEEQTASVPRAAMGLRVEVVTPEPSLAAVPAVTIETVHPADLAKPAAETGPGGNDEVFAQLDDDVLVRHESSIAGLSFSNDDLFDRWHGVDDATDASDAELGVESEWFAIG